MKTEILLSLLAVFFCSASADSALEDDQPEIDEPQPAKRIYNPELNELARRRKRNSNFGKARQCCAQAEVSCCGCCTCCKEQGTTTTTIVRYESTRVQTWRPTINYLDYFNYFDRRNFTIVLNSPDDWIIIFTYSDPSCTNCRRLDPIIKEIVIHYHQGYQQPKARIGIFYADYGDHKIYLTNVLRIFEYPTVYLYLLDKTYPYNYGIPRTADELIISVTYLVTRPPITRGDCASISKELSISSVYELNDHSFKNTVKTCDDAWVVNFYLASPDVCRNFFDIFEDAARQLNGRVKFGAFYQTKGSATLDEYGVTKKACWVKMFPRGTKGSCVLDFNNGEHSPALDRTLVQWVKNHLNYGPAQQFCSEDRTTPGEIWSPTRIQTRIPTPTRTPTTARRTYWSPTRIPTPTRTPTTTRRIFWTPTRIPTSTRTSTPIRRTTTPISTQRTTPWRRSIPTQSTSPTPRITTPVDFNNGNTYPPGTEVKQLPETPVNEAWCTYRCCIVYFMRTTLKCEMACNKNYRMQLVRSSERYGTGCALYYVFSGRRPDFETTFNINQIPMILIVTPQTRTYVTHEGVVSEPELDKFIDAYVRNKLPTKKIPKYVAPPCEDEACKR